VKTLACALALVCIHQGAWAQAQAKPLTIALVAAVGDQVDVVRQRESTSSRIEPFKRKSISVNGQALNYAVLKGLNRAIEEEEPQAQRVLLAWNTPPEVRSQLAEATGPDRESIVMAALKAHLQAMPERAHWDRIEAIVPGYFFESIKGMGRKLSGVGFYVQPLSKGAVSIEWDPNTNAVGNVTPDPSASDQGEHKTIDPNTGDVGHSTTFIASYMYFQRITLDAQTLEVLARKRQFDNIKYADPKATAIDVGDQIPLNVMTAKLLTMVEQSAYTSVRGKSYVSSTTPQAVQPAASAAKP